MNSQFDDSVKHILKSKNDRDYINKVLKAKKTVSTKACLYRIPHNNIKNDEIHLKIGRYNQDEVECSNPRSELTLDSEELQNLIGFLKENYGPIRLGVDSFIPVDGDKEAALLNYFNSIAKSDSEKARIIIESGILNKDLSSLLENQKRQKALYEFSQSLKENYPESYWQHFFESNKWVLGSEFVNVFDERKIDTKNISDFLVESIDGFLDIVEIKKPNEMSFWSANLDHGNIVPSYELVKAIVQCNNYIHRIEMKIDSKDFFDSVEKTPVARPRCLLIFGRSNDWNDDKLLAFRLLNSSLNRIKIITYDQLFARARKILGQENHDTN